MRIRTVGLLTALAAFAATPSAIAAQDTPPADGDTIVVTGELEKMQAQVQTLSKDISRRPRIDKPIARQFGAICVGVYGMSPEFAKVLIARIEDNARAFHIAVLGEGCQVNTLVTFTRDSRAEVQRLRKTEPVLFSTLKDYEIDRIMRGNGAAQAWHATQVKGANGKEFTSAVIAGREVEINKQFSASHIAQQLRTDIEGSIVMFDNRFVAGKTIQQLADYATMRLFAPTDDATKFDGSPSQATILTLFDDRNDAPAGLTLFDRSYLSALYRLPPTATGPSLAQATWSEFRRRMDKPGQTEEN